MACVGGCAVQAMLMQRGFYATQDSCAPLNALRLADKQSLGLLVGFLLLLRRLAARVAAETDSDLAPRQDLSKADFTRPARQADLSVQVISSASES